MGISSKDNALTLAAIGVVAYVCCDLLHELAGHGSVCIATGGRPISFSTTHFQCFGGWQPLINAAGILMNIATGILPWLILRWMRSASIHVRYFLWLSMAFNLFSGWGYIVQSSISNTGDWANALKGVSPAWHWRTGMAVLGVLFYGASVWIVGAEMRTVTGLGNSVRIWRLILIPYFAAGLVACAAGAVNSHVSWGQALASAAGSSLGNWGFLLLPVVLGFPRGSKENPSPPIHLAQNPGWLWAAAIFIVVFVAVVGPGVRFRSGG